MTFSSVLFDFDGTLANTLPLTIYGMQEVFKKYDNKTYDDADIIAMFGPTEDGMIRDNLRNRDRISEVIDRYYDIYKKKHEQLVEKHPKLLSLLQYLKEQKIKIGVITGKSRRSYQLSEEALGLAGLFDYVVTGDEVSEPKPNPEGIIRTLNRFQSIKDESIYIGDSNTDVLAGKRAGIHTAGVHWLPYSQSKSFPADPDYYWTDPDSFIDLLKKQMQN